MRFHLFAGAVCALFTAACAPESGAEGAGGSLTTEVEVRGTALELLVEYDESLTGEEALAAVREEALPAFERLADEDPAGFEALAAAPPVVLRLAERAPAFVATVAEAPEALGWSVDVGKCRYFFDGLSYQGYICTR
jgi:hypothetical protein